MIDIMLGKLHVNFHLEQDIIVNTKHISMSVLFNSNSLLKLTTFILQLNNLGIFKESTTVQLGYTD